MGDTVAAPPEREAGHEFETLRTLLVGPEQRDLAALRTHLEDPDVRAADVAEVLPQVLLQHAHDPHMVRALTPPLEQAITSSVQRNPQPLADALFPVMGPAIRKAVAAGLAGMVESFNRTLEHALSRRSFQWRLEAWRTGKPFAEVVLLKTLLFRVEQVFLIDRKTGLLLQHVRNGDAAVQDADMVSGMLTAIRDFVRDSFKVSDTESLEALKVGELSIWIEPGPHAMIAAVIRGTAPREFRRRLQDALETIHLQFAPTLEAFNGDASAFDDARPALEECLRTEFRADERKPRRGAVLAVAGAALVLLAIWGGFIWIRGARFASYVNALRAEPGLVVVSTERRGGRYVVSGLRDPLARDPNALLAGANLRPDQVESRWAGYQALDTPLVLTRATALLEPPPGVTLSLADGVLSASGNVPPEWVNAVRRQAPFIAGVRVFDAAGALGDRTRQTTAAIEGVTLLFIKGAARFAAGQDVALHTLTNALADLDEIAGATGQRFGVAFVGHTDTDGADVANVPLSEGRAAAARAAVAADRLTHLQVSTSGVGSRMPAVETASEAGKEKNRRVIVRVTPGASR